MQNAKDSFFVTLRDRLAALNPSRTIVVRGTARPAVLVAENELPEGEGDPLDCFILTWQQFSVDATEPMPLQQMQCGIRYTTRGSAAMAGVDRGRVLAAMDSELQAMLSPASATKQSFTTNPPTTMGTVIFWSASEPFATEQQPDRIARTVVINVFALQEAGGS